MPHSSSSRKSHNTHRNDRVEEPEKHGGEQWRNFRFDEKRGRSRSRSRSRYKSPRDINNYQSGKQFRNNSRSQSRCPGGSRDRRENDRVKRIKTESSHGEDRNKEQNLQEKKRENEDEKRRTLVEGVSFASKGDQIVTQSVTDQLSRKRKIENSTRVKKSDTKTFQSTNSRQNFVEIHKECKIVDETKKEESELPNRLTEVTIENLEKDISESEIRMTLSQNKVARPDKILILNCRDKITFCKAILSFQSFQDASEFKSKFNGKFMSNSVNMKFKKIEVNLEKSKSKEKLCNEEKKPKNDEHHISKQSIPTNFLSVRSDSFLKHSRNIPEDDIGGGSPLSGGVSPPSGGVSPPMATNVPNITVQKLLSTSFAPKVEPILVDIQCDNGFNISRIKVHLVNHKKCQQFYGKEALILVGAFLRYVKKSYPKKECMKLILVTACITSYEKFMEALLQNSTNEEMFSAFFSVWTDFQSITMNFLRNE